MNFFKNSLVLICTAVFFLSSCKNDLKLNAPYKEYPSVYAVLNPYESMQMIRINKVFLGEGNANQMAKVADSINYQPGEITITLTHSSSKKAITFRDSMVTANDGAFNTNQRVYVTNDALEKSGTYTITIKNNHTGNVFTAKSDVVAQVTKDQGIGALTTPFYPYAPGVTTGFINYSANTPTTIVGSVLFQPVSKAKIYEVIIRSHYYNQLSSTQTFDFVDYTFNDVKTTRVVGGNSYVSVSFKSGDYFSNIALGLSKKTPLDPLGRKMYLMEYIIYASTQDYVDYMEYLKPSLSLNQNKPLYSNFSEQAALGIFTFRSSMSALKELDPVFVNAFSSNVNTCSYKFYNSNNVILGCK